MIVTFYLLLSIKKALVETIESFFNKFNKDYFSNLYFLNACNPSNTASSPSSSSILNN